jgi:hypothetical protein
VDRHRLRRELDALHASEPAVDCQRIVPITVLHRRAHNPLPVVRLDGIEQAHCARMRQQRGERIAVERHGCHRSSSTASSI